MMKVMIKRTVPEGKEQDVVALLTELRTEASKQPGYISGETLRSTERADQLLVISIWEDEKDWHQWAMSDERRALQAQVDAITGVETVYERYVVPGVPHMD